MLARTLQEMALQQPGAYMTKLAISFFLFKGQMILILNTITSTAIQFYYQLLNKLL